MDVATLGIWEVVGTPLEGTLSAEDKRYIVITLMYSHKESKRVEPNTILRAAIKK